jgi:hypothetical protein
VVGIWNILPTSVIRRDGRYDIIVKQCPRLNLGQLLYAHYTSYTGTCVKVTLSKMKQITSMDVEFGSKSRVVVYF